MTAASTRARPAGNALPPAGALVEFPATVQVVSDRRRLPGLDGEQDDTELVPVYFARQWASMNATQSLHPVAWATRSIALGVIAVAALTGCSSVGTPPGPALPTLTFLTDSDDAASVLEDGDDVTFFEGFQGGHHIQPFYRLSGFPDETQIVVFSFNLQLVEADRDIHELNTRLGIVTACDQEGLLCGPTSEPFTRFFFDDAASDEIFSGDLRIDGELAEFTATAEFEDVVATSSTVTIRLVADGEGT